MGGRRSLSYVCMDDHKRNVQDGSMEIVDDQRRSEALMIQEAHNVVGLQSTSHPETPQSILGKPGKKRILAVAGHAEECLRWQPTISEPFSENREDRRDDGEEMIETD